MTTEHGEIIRRVRENKSLTQSDLAKAINTTNTYISRIELGYQRGSFETITRIALVLEIDESALLKAAGFKWPDNGSPPSFSPETYEFEKLPPKIKKLIMECVPKITKILQG